MSTKSKSVLLYMLGVLLLTACNTGKVQSLEKELATSQQQVASLESAKQELEAQVKLLTEENQVLKRTPDGQLQIALDQINKKLFREALVTLKTLVSTYPDHPTAAKAKTNIKEVTNNLANIELEKAREVRRSQGDAAAIAAFKQVVASYPGTSAATEATTTLKTLRNTLAANLLTEARNLMNSNQLELAAERVKKLLSEYPASSSVGAARSLSSEIVQRREQAVLTEVGWLLEEFDARWAFSSYGDNVVPKVDLTLKKIGESKEVFGRRDDFLDVKVYFYEVQDGSRKSVGFGWRNVSDTSVGTSYSFELEGSTGYRTLLDGALGAAAQVENLPNVEYELVVKPGFMAEPVVAKKGVIERRVTFQ